MSVRERIQLFERSAPSSVGSSQSPVLPSRKKLQLEEPTQSAHRFPTPPPAQRAGSIPGRRMSLLDPQSPKLSDYGDDDFNFLYSSEFSNELNEMNKNNKINLTNFINKPIFPKFNLYHEM